MRKFEHHHLFERRDSGQHYPSGGRPSSINLDLTVPVKPDRARKLSPGPWRSTSTSRFQQTELQRAGLHLCLPSYALCRPCRKSWTQALTFGYSK